MQDKTYRYRDKDEQEFTIDLSPELQNKAKDAINKYESSRKWINARYTFQWRRAEKVYRLDTADRKAKAKLKDWQSNIPCGISRAHVDVFISSLNENPIVFTGSPIGDTTPETKENILQALTYVADKTGFQKESKKGLKNGLKTGQFAFRVSYLKKQKIIKYTTMENGVPVEKEYKKGGMSMPYAKSISNFSVFPDPYPGVLRYITERGVTSYESFIESFGFIIDSPDNKSPFKDKAFLQNLSLNKNDADFIDYGAVGLDVYQQKNWEDWGDDTYKNNIVQASSPNTTLNSTDDPEVTEGLIEFKFFVSTTDCVLHANGYPVYIGKNPYPHNIIPYVVKSANDENARLGCEGIIYLLRGMEETITSYLNNLVDSARAVSTPSFMMPEGLFIEPDSLRQMGPGTIHEYNNTLSTGPRLERIDKGSVTDNGIMQVVQGFAQQIDGVSEYNLGISSRERTATGANAVAQSSQKRLSPFLSNFIDCVGEIAQIWLLLMVEYWTEEQMVSVTDSNGLTTMKRLKNEDIAGDLTISLDVNGMIAQRSDLNTKRKIEFYPQLKQSGVINESEYIADIMRELDMNPNKLIVDYSKVKADNPAAAIMEELPNQSLAEEVGQELSQAVTPSIDLGNSGQGADGL